MGLRFNKRVRIAKGVHLNLSKSGISTSFGGRGFSTSVGKRGVRMNVGVPGTGLSYNTKIAGGSKRKSSGKSSPARPSRPSGTHGSLASRSASPAPVAPFNHKVRVTDAGEILFVCPDGSVVEDKDLIAQLKRHPAYRERKGFFEAKALEKSKEHAERIQEETDSFIDIYRLSPAIHSRAAYEERLATLVPQTYAREEYGAAPPTLQGVRSQLEAQAEHEVSALFPWKKQRLAQEWVDARVDGAFQAAMSEWEERKRNFDARQDEIARHENQRLQEACEEERRCLELALAGDKDYVEDWIAEWLAGCELPVGIDVDFDYSPDAGALMIDLDLPEIENMPTTTTSQLASGKYKEKNKTQKQIKEEYCRCVLGLVVLVASSMFNASPCIQRVVVSGYTQRRNKAGDLQDDYIVSVDFGRDVMASLPYAEDDPMDTVLRFPNRMNLTSSKIFKVIEPFA